MNEFYLTIENQLLGDGLDQPKLLESIENAIF